MWMGLEECLEAVDKGTIPNCFYRDELEMLQKYLMRQ